MDKPRILVAEDEGIIAKDLEGTLKGMGYAVSGIASSGEEAIRKALETKPNLVLMDIVLRGDMDGVAAAEEIRARLGIPVIFLTAYADEKTLQRAKISGPFGYMLKPFEERELRGAIEVALDRHGMEKKLRKAAEEWRSTFDSIQDWVSIHDRDFRIVRVNRAMADAFRRAPQDMIGKTCYEVFHRSNEPIPQCPHIRTLETRRPGREEIFDPSLGIHLEISISPVFDGKGELTGTVHIAKDISERKRADEALRKSDEEARRLARENAVMAEIGRVISSSLNIGEIYERFTEKVQTLVSFARLAVNLISRDGKSFSIPYVSGLEIKGRGRGEEIPLAGTATEAVVRTRSSLLLREKDEEEILARFPGIRPIFEAGFGEVILVPMIASGGCLGVLNFLSYREGGYGLKEVEVAERVADQIAGAVANSRLHRQTIEAQEDLRESEERYRRLFEGLPIGLYRSTPGGKLLDANPAMARLFGYPDTDSLRRAELVDTYVTPQDRERFKVLMEEKGLVEQFRVERRRRDGSRFWSDTQSLAVRGPDGAIQCYEGSVQNVSDQQAFEEKLRLSENDARQLALEKSILAEIGRIVSSTTDIEEVYKSFAEEVKKLLPFDRLIVTLVERGKGTMVNRFVEGTSVPGRNMGEVFPLRETFGEAVIKSRRGIRLQVENEEETASRFPGLLMDLRAGLKSSLSVPLFYRDEAMGVLHIFSGTSKAYREEDLPTARSIADQIAGAMVNAQLFLERKQAGEVLRRSEETARRLAEENMLMAEIGRIISSSRDIKEVYGSFGEVVRRLIPFDRIAINTIDRDGQTYTISHVFGSEIPGRESGKTVPITGSATEIIKAKGSSMLLQKADEKEINRKTPGFGPIFRAGFHSIIMVPLISQDRVIGVLSFQSNRSDAYGQKDVKVAESIGRQIAGAVSNAQLFNELRKTTEALGELEQRNRALVEAVGRAGEGVIILQNTESREAVFVFANEQTLKILGYTMDELRGLTWKDVVHPSLLEKVEDRYRRRADGENLAGLYEIIILNKDRREVPIEIIGIPIRFQGAPAVAAFFRDITDRKRAQEAVRRNEVLLRNVLDALPVGVTITDEKGKVLLTNPARKQIWGEKKFEDISQIGEYKGWWADSGKKLEEDEWGLSRAVKTGEPSLKQIIQIEGMEGKKKTVLNSGVPIRDEKGELLGAIGVSQDISDFKQAKESIKKTKEFYETVINSMKDALSIIDVKDFKIVEANKVFFDRLGMEKEEVIGKKCYELTHQFSSPCDSPEHACPILGTLRTGISSVAEHVHYGKEGAKRHVEVSASPIKNERGEIIQAVHVDIDITQRKHLEGQLAQAQKLEAVGQLAAGIAHEINTPTQYVGDNTRFLQDAFKDLNHLLGKHGELLQAVKRGEDPKPIAQEVEVTVESIGLPYLAEEIPRAICQTLEGVDRVTQIVRAMKEFSHPGVKEKTLVDINKAIENTMIVSRNEWKYVAELATDLDPSLPPVPCHLGEFNQVILNLVVNAAHAIAGVAGDGSRGKGTIRIATRQEKDWVEVRISDTGGGIPENIRSRIFDPFFTTKTVGKGTGQGLAIAHSVIVGKHGGTIHFETEMGEGTTFIIRLPIAPKESEQGSGGEEGKGSEAGGKGLEVGGKRVEGG